MFTLVELKNIARKEEISIFSNANKVDYINLLKDKILVSIEFTI